MITTINASQYWESLYNRRIILFKNKKKKQGAVFSDFTLSMIIFYAFEKLT